MHFYAFNDVIQNMSMNHIILSQVIEKMRNLLETKCIFNPLKEVIQDMRMHHISGILSLFIEKGAAQLCAPRRRVRGVLGGQ